VALTPPLASALASDSHSPPPEFTAKPPRALIVKQMAASIRLVIDTLTNPANPAAAIDRIGITRGKIVIDDETANQTMVFNGVNLGFDKTSGATRFDLSVEGPNGRALASGLADSAASCFRFQIYPSMKSCWRPAPARSAPISICRCQASSASAYKPMGCFRRRQASSNSGRVTCVSTIPTMNP
jgi:hypothetical protein